MISTNRKGKINPVIIKVSSLVLFILFISLNTGICRMREMPKSFTVKCARLECVPRKNLFPKSQPNLGSILPEWVDSIPISTPLGECEPQKYISPTTDINLDEILRLYESNAKSSPLGPVLDKITQSIPILAEETGIIANFVIQSTPLPARWDPLDTGTGLWEDIADGTKLWRLRIHRLKSKSLSLAITQFCLPSGAKLWIYNPSGKYVEGPYMEEDETNGQLWTPIIPGEEVVVELCLPSGIPREDAIIFIGDVIPNTLDLKLDRNVRGHCNIDVACPEANKWRNQIRSVALYTVDGVFWCSGVLLNNTSGDLTPYFLTAAHCNVNEKNAHTMVFYWNFQSPQCTKCGDTIDHGNLRHNQTGAIFRAKWTDMEGSDFVLVELKKKPDPDFNVYYSGWDASGETPESAVGIHHPHGYEKAICFSGGKIGSIDRNIKKITFREKIYWYIQEWERGTTEAHSSGSGLWDACSGLCIGQLNGPPVGCKAPPSCKPNKDASYYGKLSASWEGGETCKTPLKDWLDPIHIFERTGKPPKLIGIDAPTLRTIKHNLLKVKKIIIELHSGKLSSLDYLINGFNRVWKISGKAY